MCRTFKYAGAVDKPHRIFFLYGAEQAFIEEAAAIYVAAFSLSRGEFVIIAFALLII